MRRCSRRAARPGSETLKVRRAGATRIRRVSIPIQESIDVDDSTEAPSLPRIALLPSLQDTKQGIDGLMALINFQYRCEELRRSFEEDGIPVSYGQAVDAYRFLARLLAIELGPEREDPERVDSMGALVSFQDGAYWIQEPVVRVIVEGFEREIAEDSATLYIVHDGEAEPRKVEPWKRFRVYQSLAAFVEAISPRENELPDEWRRLFERAQAVLDKRTVNRPRGGPDPRLNVARDSCVLGGLSMLQDLGLTVTSSKPRASLAAAMSEAMDIPESTIAKVWENAAGVPALARPGKGSRNRPDVVPCMECGAPVERERLREGLSHRCNACADASLDALLPG